MDTLILAEAPDPLAEAVAARLRGWGRAVEVAPEPSPRQWEVVWLRHMPGDAPLQTWLDRWCGRVLSRLNPDFWVRPERGAAEWRSALWAAGLPVAPARVTTRVVRQRACVGARRQYSLEESGYLIAHGAPFSTAWVVGTNRLVWDGAPIPALADGLERLARWCGVDLMAVAFEQIAGVPFASTVELMPGPAADERVHLQVVEAMAALIAGR